MPKNRRGGQRAGGGAVGPNTGGQRGKTAEQIIEQALGPKGAVPSEMYDYFDTVNPNFSTGDYEWTCNCQRCIWAVEAQARGYDVEAMPKKHGDDHGKADTTYPQSYLNVGNPPIELNRIGDVWRVPTDAEVENAILGNNPEGARGFLRMRTSSGGHVINWEIKNGHVTFYDGQDGGIQAAINLTSRYTDFWWGRMDDKAFTPLIAEFVKQHRS